MATSDLFTELVEIMAFLRDPEKGCPWDAEQDFRSIAPYTIEEACEVADAAERGDMDDLADELGDLLLQVIFHAQMAAESGYFDIDEVCRRLRDKMIRRHPHVFGNEVITHAGAVSRRWDEIKQQEAGRDNTSNSRMDGVAMSLPALMRAQKLQRRAARAGFDWPDHTGVTGKLGEELSELKQAIQASDSRRMQEEMGDLIFTCVNLSRHLHLDAESALRDANRKFTGRFRAMESMAEAAGQSLDDLGMEELEQYWERVKTMSN